MLSLPHNLEHIPKRLVCYRTFAWQQVHVLCCYKTDTSKATATRTNNCLYLTTTVMAHWKPKVTSLSVSWQGPKFRTGCSRYSSNCNYDCSSLLSSQPWLAGGCLPSKDTQFKTAILHSEAKLTMNEFSHTETRYTTNTQIIFSTRGNPGKHATSHLNWEMNTF